MTELDPVSQLLGELKADMRNAEQSRKILRGEVTKMGSSVEELTVAITALGETMKHIDSRITAVERELKPLTELRQRGMGMLAVLTVILGGIGTAIVEGLKHVAGKWP